MALGFVGTFEPKLDDKGRLILPAKYREGMEGGIVLTRGQDGCIYGFPTHEFELFSQGLRAAPVTHAQARRFVRMCLSGAQEQTPDKQGRITIPVMLREYAGLSRDLAVIGTGNRIEIWDSESWNNFVDEHIDEYSQTAEEVIPGIF